MSKERTAVLVIDDDPDFRELVRLSIELDGIEVLEAHDCAHGVAVLDEARDRIGLVLLDYWMPNMEPTCCCKRIRALAGPDTRVVLVTAAVDAKKRAIELGLSDWLSKPFDFERLRRILREHPMST